MSFTKINQFALEWKGFGRVPSECLIRAYVGQGHCEGKTVVLATDIGKGTSVTNGCEEIAAELVNNHGFSPDAMVFVEHYRDGEKDETFDAVEFHWHDDLRKFTTPKWHPSNREQFLDWIGCSSEQEPLTNGFGQIFEREAPKAA